MKKIFMFLGLAVAFASQAADYILDFTAATPVASEAPVLRRAEMPLAVGQIPSVAVGDRLTFKLFEGVSIDAKVSAALPSSFTEGRTFSLTLGDGVFSSTFVENSDGVLIELRDIGAGMLYVVVARGDEVYIEETDLSLLRRGNCIEVETPELDADGAGYDESSTNKKPLLGAVPGNPFDDNVVAPAPVMVDIMLVFDNGAQAWIEKSAKYSSITNFAIAQVAKMNMVLRNTDLHTNFWYRLVDVATVDYRWTTIDDTILPSIEAAMRTRSGVWANIRDRREACGADVVSLMIDTGSMYGVTGIGYTTHGTTYNEWVNSYRRWCYSCCAIRSVDAEYTLCHEVGHNMGLTHSPTLASWKKVATFDYSNGYNITNATDGVHYNTIMAYNYDRDYSDYREIPYFSSPLHKYAGVPVGTTISNDCTRALRQTCVGIADWHAQTLPLPSDVIFSPSGTSAYRISLSNLGGYEIRYTTDGTTPTRESMLYSNPIILKSGSMTLKAVAVVDENTIGAVAEKTYNAAVELDKYIMLEDTAENWWWGYWRDQDSEYIYPSYWATSADKTAILDIGGSIAVDGNIELGTVLVGADDAMEIVTYDKTLFATNLEVIGKAKLTGPGFTFTSWKLHEDSTLILSPGEGNTTTLSKYLALGATGSAIEITNGTLKVTKGANSGDGVSTLQNASVTIDYGGILSLDPGWVFGFSNKNPVTVNKGGLLKINALESTARPFVLNGGNIDVNVSGRAFELRATEVKVTADSAISDKTSNGSAKLYLDTGNTTFDVADCCTLTVGLGTSKDNGIVKSGAGEIRFLRELLHTGANTINSGTFTIAYNSTTTNCADWILHKGATLKIENGCSLQVPSLELVHGSALELPAAGAAPLAISNSVSLAGVAFRLTGAGDLTLGATYPLIAVSGRFKYIAKIDKSVMPALDSGLGWKFAVDNNNVLSASVVNEADADEPVAVVCADDDLVLEIPTDATTALGAITVVSNPLSVEGINDTAVAITLDVTLPASDGTSEETICSWFINDNNVVRCVRRADGVLDVFYNGNNHINNSTNNVTLTAGRHILKIGYNYGTYGGTWVFVDDEPAYWATTLKWTGKEVTKLAIGGTTEDEPKYSCPGLVLHGVGVLKANSNLALPNMTGSEGITYNYVIANKSPANSIPSVFPRAISGGFSMDNSLLDANLPSSADSIAVSIVASFPADKAGCLFGVWAKNPSSNYSYTEQFDYGSGGFSASYNGYVNAGYYTVVNEPNPSVEQPHLYTLTYTIDEGFKFYQDGVEILDASSGFVDKGYKVYNKVTFGRGPWNNLTTSYNDNPNPMSNFHVYASHIELGSDERMVSEDAVMESLNFAPEYDEMTIAEKLSYLPTCQTATGVDVPAGGFNEPEEPEKPEVLPIVRLPVVDILVAFDNGAQAYVAEKSMSLEAFAEAQIAKMNDALATNRLDACYSYRLAGVCKVDATYRQINAISTELAEGVGALVVLRTQRELYGADTVTLLIDNVNDATLGYGCPMTTTDASSCNDDAFSVCSIKAVHTGKQHTMLHENAHNMGCGHADNVQACSPFAYGRGFYFEDPEDLGVSYHTIMAYGGNDDASWYFSTSDNEYPELYRSEFGYIELGDANHDNRRVLTETCGTVSQWRDGVKPFAEDVVAMDSAGEEIFSGRVFKESIQVVLSSPDDATIYYTTDGTAPTSASSVYSSPLCITEDTTLMVASLNGTALSPVRTIKLFRMDAIPDEGVWRTSTKYPWSDAGQGELRSFNYTEYGHKCTTPLSVKVEGPKLLRFKHKSYFSTPEVDSNYSHIEVLLDDSAVLSTNYFDVAWSEDVEVVIPSGEHEVQFVYSQRDSLYAPFGNFIKDGNVPLYEEALWIKDIAFDEVPRVEFVNNTSTSDDVAWELPYVYEAKELDGNLGGIEVVTKGVVETLGFGSTNAVVLSVLAELPEGEKGEIAGCKIVQPAQTWTAGGTFHAFAYSNGDGTFSLGYGTTTNHVTSTAEKVSNWTGLHVWTFAFAAQGGAKLYCDGDLLISAGNIQWGGSSIADTVAYGDDPRGGWALTGAKVYAVHSAFGDSDDVFDTVSSSVDSVLSSFGCLAEYADESQATKFALLRIYKDTGSVIGEATGECVLRISEIMPKPTDDRTLNGREGMDVNGLESGWVEVENTSDQWADLKDYKFIRTNRSKANSKGDYGNFPSYLVPPYSRAIFYTSERYSNSASMKDSAWATADPNGAKPKLYGEALGNVLVWPDKVNPKKSPFVRLIHTPSGVIADTVVVPSDVPEGYSIIVGEVKESLATERWLCPTPTRGRTNAKTDGLTRIGPNAGPLYENRTVDKKGKEVIGAKHDSANEFARVAPPAKSGEAYEITFSFNPVMSPTEAAGFRDEDEISSITLVYRAGLTGAENEVAVDMDADNFDPVDWGHTYKAEIPADKLPGAGQLVQWKFRVTDASGNEWTSPSFNNPDDGYEWYGTIVEAPELESATLPTWHMFVDNASKAQMDYDKDDSRYTLPNGARVAIYDSSTSNYYDYVRIDLRGHTSANFTKKGHGLRFAKAHPLTMVDSVTGEAIEEIRKTSLISEFADPSFMRQMIAFWLWKKMGNLVPFDFPVRCNLNGEFYQLAFNSERFTDELIEDVYGLDKYGYSWKNVGTLKSDSKTTAGSIEKKTPDDEDESNVTVLENELRSKITAAHENDVENHAELTKFVVQKFNLPAWINYLASARITQEMDDVWANVCIYYDNPDMKEGARGTGTWMPLGYDFNLSFGQYYYDDIKNYGNSRNGLMATNDWYKSHPFYGGNKVVAYRNSSKEGAMNGNDGFEAVWQSSKFRRLYLRRLRTLMDQELKSPGTAEGATPFMMKMRKMAGLMRADAMSDQTKWPNDNKDDAIDVWGNNRPANMDAGINDIWNNYVVPRREHLYVTHSVTNTAKAVGYGSNLNAGIPEAQSPFAELIAKIDINTNDCANGVVIICNNNDEVVDMSGWTLTTGSGKKDFWELPAGTVCDSNDCIYVVSDRRKYIADHESELTDQIIVGNATFGDFTVESTLTAAEAPDATEGVSVEDTGVEISAADEAAAKAWADSVSPALTEEDSVAGLDAQYLKVVAEPVEGSPGKYKATVVVNPATVEAPKVEVENPAAESEPVEIEEDDKGETTVSVSISNAIQGLWYGYEVSDELGESAAFANDVDSFERAAGPAHTVKGSPRDKASGFFRVKVLPAKPLK